MAQHSTTPQVQTSNPHPVIPVPYLQQVQVLSDPILAYQFEYPTAGASGRPLAMLLSRVPEKYSSAAPLTADARQRIVSEVGRAVPC